METAEFVFDFDLEDEAKIVIEALRPEIKHKIPKVEADVSISGEKVFLVIHATDISSLRAACNSYLRWVKTALDIIRVTW